MKRIIQKYQEGGVVQPGVATGLPAGGNAGPAIQRYLDGYVSSPLSYNGVRNSYVPDYRKLAAKRKEERDDTTTTTTTGTDTTYTAPTGIDVRNQDSTRETAADINTLAADRIATNRVNVDAIVAVGDGNIAPVPNILDASQSDEEYYQKFRENYEAAEAHAADNPFGQTTGTPLYEQGFPDGNSLLPASGQTPSSTPFGLNLTGPLHPENTGYITGGNAGHATDNDKTYNAYYDQQFVDPISGKSLTSFQLDNRIGGGGALGQSYADAGITSGAQVVADQNAAAAAAAALVAPRGNLVYNNDERWEIWSEGKKVGEDSNANDARERLATIDAASLEKFNSLNNGGPISMNPSRVQKYNNGSTGGVAIANTRLSEEEIRQRQLMQSPLPQAQASPLSNIGSQLAMGAVDKGIGSAASSMAAKKGLMSTFGKALGGNAATGAATSAAGTGLMAALGPIGIGLGLGKLFGVFNDGGKVPYTKRKKSPLSGE